MREVSYCIDAGFWAVGCGWQRLEQMRRLLRASDSLTVTVPIQLALARSHRWLAMLESGETHTLYEVAEREGMDWAHVIRIMRLTPWRRTSWLRSST